MSRTCLVQNIGDTFSNPQVVLTTAGCFFTINTGFITFCLKQLVKPDFMYHFPLVLMGDCGCNCYSPPYPVGMDYIYHKNLPNVGKYMPLPWIVWDIYAKFHMPYCHSLHSKSPNDTMHPMGCKGYFTPIHIWIQGAMVLISEARTCSRIQGRRQGGVAWQGVLVGFGCSVGWLVGGKIPEQ